LIPTQLASPFDQWTPVPLVAAARLGEGELLQVRENSLTFDSYAPTRRVNLPVAIYGKRDPNR